MDLKKISTIISFLAIALFLTACTPRITEETAPIEEVESIPAEEDQAQVVTLTPATPTVTIIEIAEFASAGDNATIRWWVYTPTKNSADKTALLYGFASYPGSFGNTTPESSGYLYMSRDYIESLAPLDTPGSYYATIDIPAGDTLYVRAYASIDGDNYWSEEEAINIRATE